MANTVIPSELLADGSVVTAKIADDAVTGAKIENAVTIATSVTSPLIDGQNFKINGGQGTDGQLLTSTGSGVAWEDAPAGGPTFKTFGTDSIMIGDTTTGTINAANYNTGLGVDVFAALTSGDNNVAVGFQSLTANTTGGSNTSVGYKSLDANTTGSSNTSVGKSAMGAATEGDNNTGIGAGALGSLTTGSQNTAVGTSAGGGTTASNNTSVGYAALTANTTAGDNTAVGVSALAANTTGSQNVAVGALALDANTTAPYNTAVGYGSLGANVTGNQNTAVGYLSLAANTALKNTAVGAYAQYQSTTAQESTAIGYAALAALTSGHYNTAVGNGALSANTTGSNNTAVGYGALDANSTSPANTAVGYNAATDVTGGENTCIGYSAASYQNSLTTGAANTIIGAYARTSSATVSNESVYGRYALGQGANTVTLGMSGNGVHITLNGSTTSWSAHSDERFKENIQDSTAGLSFINDLRPITYNWKSKKDISKDFVNYYDADSDEPVQGQVKQTNHGFIAQEVKTAIDAHPEIKEGHSIWRESPDGVQNVADGALVPMLVKAIQELSAEVETLKSQLGE